MVRPRVFFDIAVGNDAVGRVIFELFNDTAPRTCENFRALCTGEKGLSSLSERPLYYKNSIFHRCIPGFMVQAGDFTKRNGTGGESIYGGPFADEDLTRPADAAGLLCMANKGPNTNSSQFFITLRDCPHLNGKHVVFGRVIRGYEVVEKIAAVPVDAKDRPTVPITIANCGELVLRTKTEVADGEARARLSSGLASEDESSSDGDRLRRKRRRHRHRSESQEGVSDENGDRHRRHKKSKAKKDRSRSPPQKEAESKPVVEEETEEQYDARLEREEKERLEAERLKELKRMKSRLEQSTLAKNGVRFKGRGRMKYVDPEMHR